MNFKKFKIGVFTSNLQMIEDIRVHVQTDDEIDIHIATQGLDDSLPVAQKMVREGVEVILGRRGTAHMLREALHIPVLAFPQSDLNLILRLKEASVISDRIALPIFRSRIEHLDELFQLLKINVVQMVYKDSASLEKIIALAYQQGTEVIVGGPHSISIAKNYGLKVVEIQSSRETIVTTIEDAKSVIRSNRLEHEVSLKYQTIINSASDGIIAIDARNKITLLNFAAKKMLRFDDSVIGMRADDVFRNKRLLNSLKDKKLIYDHIEDVGDKTYVFNHTPIMAGDYILGVVSTFNDVGNVIKAENKVRKKMTKGLVAHYSIKNLSFRSREMSEVVSRVERFSRTDSTILLAGETGTGKEIFAQSIHNLSRRKSKPFVSINCAAIPENLLESELFGYEEGAFTGSRKGGKAGLFELAHTGTMFLDEISAASVAVQTRLLRVLQEREVMRIGSDRVVPIDVRVIAAANTDLAQDARAGNFREDLYFRLNVLRVNLPPLRSRADDIPLLLERFLGEFADEHRLKPLPIPARYMKVLCSYPWPGNVRQLRNLAERLTLLCDSIFNVEVFDELYNELQEYFSRNNFEEIIQKSSSKDNHDIRKRLQNRKKENDAEIIISALEEAKYNKNETAKILGISRNTLWRKMKELGLG